MCNTSLQIKMWTGPTKKERLIFLNLIYLKKCILGFFLSIKNIPFRGLLLVRSLIFFGKKSLILAMAAFI